jgi:hypothetical protein
MKVTTSAGASRLPISQMTGAPRRTQFHRLSALLVSSFGPAPPDTQTRNAQKYRSDKRSIDVSVTKIEAAAELQVFYAEAAKIHIIGLSKITDLLVAAPVGEAYSGGGPGKGRLTAGDTKCRTR